MQRGGGGMAWHTPYIGVDSIHATTTTTPKKKNQKKNRCQRRFLVEEGTDLGGWQGLHIGKGGQWDGGRKGWVGCLFSWCVFFRGGVCEVGGVEV